MRGEAASCHGFVTLTQTCRRLLVNLREMPCLHQNARYMAFMIGTMAQSKHRRSWRTWDVVRVVLGVLLAPALLLLFAVGYASVWVLLHLVIWIAWNTRGRDVLFVYSDSPVWREHVERRFLPYLGRRAVVLNWSERKRWRPTLGVIAFRFFGGYREFNPIAIVFRPLRRAKKFRFWKGFRDLKHGRPHALQALERSFFDHIGVSREDLPDPV